jgi:hypothetical protein
MAVDHSPYTIEQRLVTAGWLHERPYSGDPGDSESEISRLLSNMAVDQSPYSIEQRLVTAVRLHERPYSGDTLETVKVKFQDRFGVEPPSKATMLGWKKCAFATSSVKDRP